MIVRAIAIPCGLAFAAFSWWWRPLRVEDVPAMIVMVIVGLMTAVLHVNTRSGRWTLDGAVVAACAYLCPGGPLSLLMLSVGEPFVAQRWRQRPLLSWFSGRAIRCMYYTPASMLASGLHGDARMFVFLALAIGLNYPVVGFWLSLALERSWWSMLRGALSLNMLISDFVQGLAALIVLKVPLQMLPEVSLMLAGFVFVVRSNVIARDRLERLQHDVSRDPLTGLLNRRGVEEQVGRLLERCARDGSGACVLMIDLDHFKRVNDTFGHDRGDEILKLAGKVLTESLRLGDLAARWGGEEFCVVLSGVDELTGQAIGERIRDNFHRQLSRPGEVSLSLSVGVCGLRPGGFKAMVLGADQALYEAKNSGRNRVRLAA